ncbi:hypothetical protein LPTSP4_29190 [Leptospira ryugenii]|uniref:Lipoprotein n=1 Tax=Leptospira ryugenii TaxID=1917863 RepID=A0A2P2E3A5_9LEPT|nr:hypothetical protein [Leptospira ryugenii]GBF51383.1 hypothetical protein LPTSP4_29190 [Leptospira ryugenii]
MNHTKTKNLLLICLLTAMSFTLLSGCKEDKDDDDTTNLLVLLAAGTSSAGDCVVNTSGRGSISTFVTDLTVSGASKTGTISRISTIPLIGHQSSAIKFTVTGPTTVTLAGNAFGILYKSDACPLAASSALSYNSGFTTTASDSSSEFATSHKFTSTITTTIVTTGTYYYFFYAIPSRGQNALVTYTVNP